MICPTCGHDNLPGIEQCVNCLTDLSQLDRPTAQDRVERSLMEDPVRVLQPRAPVTITPETTVGQAIQMLLEQNLGALLVVNSEGILQGIFSERDLITRVAGVHFDYADMPVSRFMTRAPESVSGDDTLAFALHKMDVGGYRHLPIVENGRAVGMISVRDMLRHFTRLCK